MSPFDASKLKFNGEGLVPIIAQDERTGDVLMLAWADRAAIDKTLASGFVHYHSRSRGKLWKKGEESGHVQKLVSLHSDCDGDAVLALVHQTGPACHEGTPTCFERKGEPVPTHVLASLADLIESRKKGAPAGSYTAKLLGDANLRTKKIGEEATELVMALKGEGPERIASEAADVIYHLLVACAASGVQWTDIAAELGKRKK